MKTHLFSYNYDGSSWVFELKADNAADAKRRLARIAFAEYDGELIAKANVPLGGLLARLIALCRGSK